MHISTASHVCTKRNIRIYLDLMQLIGSNANRCSCFSLSLCYCFFYICRYQDYCKLTCPTISSHIHVYYLFLLHISFISILSLFISILSLVFFFLFLYIVMYHHTEADTIDKIDPSMLLQNVQVFASMAYLLAEIEETLPRTK